jgi:anti-anti-sigma factor
MAAEESAVRVEWAGGKIAVVALSGDHDLSTVAVVEQELVRAGEQAAGIVVDLREGSFIDSSVIHALLDASQSASERGIGFSLCLGSARVVEKALKLTGVTTHIACASEIGAAIGLASGRKEAR